jgi:hypothetical protein
MPIDLTDGKWVITAPAADTTSPAKPMITAGARLVAHRGSYTTGSFLAISGSKAG